MDYYARWPRSRGPLEYCIWIGWQCEVKEKGPGIEPEIRGATVGVEKDKQARWARQDTGTEGRGLGGGGGGEARVRRRRTVQKEGEEAAVKERVNIGADTLCVPAKRPEEARCRTEATPWLQNARTAQATPSNDKRRVVCLQRPTSSSTFLG